ncbi:hypothetical protein BH09SUM1_BH09SUM1_02010 [soil metagenome]
MSRVALNSVAGRRGSTILVVLALLSVLILLAATLAFTSRIDVISAKNFGRSVQNGTAALTGVQRASMKTFTTLPKSGALGNAQIAAYESELNNAKTQQKSAAATQTASFVRTDTARVIVRDASARVNVNTADAKALETLLREVGQQRQIQVDAAGLSKAIVQYRLGRDGAPGIRGVDDNQSEKQALTETAKLAFSSASISSDQVETNQETALERLGETCMANAEERRADVKSLLNGVDEADEFVADIRYPAYGDDRRFQTLTDLMRVPGMKGGIVKALEPYVTVFSLSQASGLASTDSHDEADAPLDLNRATAEDIADALKKLYGGSKDETLLLQFAANIVDMRDSDNKPTVLEGPKGTKILGLERTPLITEVYADSVTPQENGDDGQYVEIYNPWEESISLTGWSLRVSGQRIPLQGTLPSRGYLIVTDDFDNSADAHAKDDLAGTGSLYDIFKVAQNGGTKRVLEVTSLAIPDTRGVYTVDLQDANGDLADEFIYTITDDISTLDSFQRKSILVREIKLDRATPFTLLAPGPEAEKVADNVKVLPANAPFTTPLELFGVFAGVPGSAESRWGFPVMATPNSTAPADVAMANDPRRIDARAIDLFTVELAERSDREKVLKNQSNRVTSAAGRAATLVDYRRGAEVLHLNSQAQGEALAWGDYAEAPRGQRLGRINVNTATETVLLSAGFTKAQAGAISRTRAEAETNAAPYQKLSDVLVDDHIWGNSVRGCDRLAAFAPVYDRISVGSRSFLVEGQAVESSNGTIAKRSGTRMEAVVAMDKARPEVVGWHFMP